MRTILVANPKGGCGKTTIATNLSGYYANKGVSVSLVDLDQQHSSVFWGKSRNISKPKIKILEELQESYKTKRVIYDCPAQISIDLTIDLINRSDVIIIPINPSIIDQWAALKFVLDIRSLFRENKCKRIQIGFVANRANKGFNSYEELKSFTDLMKTPLITSLRNSQNYVKAAEKGLTIFDMPDHLVLIDKEQWKPLAYWAEGRILKKKALKREKTIKKRVKVTQLKSVK